MSEINLKYRYLCGMTAAAAGRNAYFVLVAWIVVDASRSPALVAVLLAAGSMAEFLTANLGGSAVDRFDRRLTCLVCDIFRLIIMGATFAGLACFDPIPVLVVSWLAYAVVDRTYLTSLQALIPSIVATERLMAFNSLSYIAMQVGNLLAALATGILLVVIPERFGLLVPLFCFALSFVAIFGRSWLVIREAGRKPSIRLRLSDVLPTALPSGPLLMGAAVYALIYAMGMLVNVLASALVIQQLTGTALDFSYLEAAWAGGSVAGCIGLLFREPRSHRLVSHLALSGFILTGFILLQGLMTSIVQMAILGISYNVARVIVDVQVQCSVPSHMLGRVRSRIHTLCVATGLAAYGLIAIIGPGVEPSTIFGCYGIVLIAAAFLIFYVSQRRGTTAEWPRLKPMSTTPPGPHGLSKADVMALMLDLFPWVRDFRDAPVRDYAAALFAASPSPACSTRQHAKSLLVSWIASCARRRGYNARQTERIQAEITDNPVMQTGPHLHLLFEPDAFYTHLFSLMGLQARNTRSYISYACSTVKFVERGRKGPGWLTLDGQSINVFGLTRSRMIPYSVLAENGGYRFQLKNADRPEHALASVARLAQEMPATEFLSAADAIQQANVSLWQRFLKPEVDLLQLDDRDVADMVVMHLADPQSWLCSALFADTELPLAILSAIDRLDSGPWRGWLRNATHFFWGCEEGRIFPLHLEDGFLCSDHQHAVRLPFTAPALSEALTGRTIVPNLLLVFIVIAILPGVRVLGGSRHAVYYPLMRYAVCDALAKAGGDIALLGNLMRDERPGAWGHRIISAPFEPFSLLHNAGPGGLSSLIARFGSMTLEEACGGMTSFTEDPLWADLARAFRCGDATETGGPWAFS